MGIVHSNQQRKTPTPGFFGKLALITLSMLILTVFGFKFVASSSFAAGTQVSVKVNYIDDTVTVTGGAGQSTKFYISKNAMKTWELMETNGVMDLSMLLSTKEVSLYFKGNRDPEPIEVKLQGLITSLVSEYKVINGDGYILLTGTSQTIEYRNGKDGQWRILGMNLIPTSSYELNGATLNFRTVATQQVRSGKIITTKINKKGTAPAVKLDGGKLSISGLKVGQTQYRVGDSTVWMDFAPIDSKVKTLDVKSLLAPTLPDNTPIPAGIIEFRTKATDKKVASAVKVLSVHQQAFAPENVQLLGTTLTAFDIDLKKAYEYTVVKAGVFNINSAKWTTFNGSKPVMVKTASLGDTILVRVKSTTDSKTKDVILASIYKSFLVTSISY